MRMRLAGFTIIALLTATVAAFADANSDAPPVYPSRVFAPAPPVGVHPRVLFSPSEMPELTYRLLNTASGKSIMAVSAKAVAGQSKLLKELAALQPGDITDEIAGKYWKSDEERNQAFLQAAIIGLVKNDPDMKRLAIESVVGYCRVIEKAKELKLDMPMNSLSTGLRSKSGNSIWGSPHWDLNTGWVNGGLGMGLTYDFLYNDITQGQRDLIRQTLSDITSHRRSFDMEDPDTHEFYPARLMTNWALYHGTLPLLALCIEGENGYDPEIYQIWSKMIPLYLHQAIYKSGGCGEDSYPLGTSLRESGPTMVAMAKRGENLFTDPNYQAFWTMVAQALEPFPGGGFIGGSGGGGSTRTEGGAMGYAGSWVTAHYGVPTSPVINYLWRRYVGEKYDQHLAFQSYAQELLFSTDWNAEIKGSNDLSQLGLPLTAYYPGRGLQISRSDWSANALDVHVDGRADAFLVGHDTVDRGNFTVTALGETWAPYPDWMGFMYGDEHSLVQIDGKSEDWKAPSVKYLASEDNGKTALAALDLSYAYDWQWPPPWPKIGETFPAPWEKEPSDPRALGLPDTADFAWVPKELYGHPEAGFQGLNFWRKPYNPVQKCFRTLLLVRGKHPYLLVADDVKKDDAAHKYDWLLQLDIDITLLHQDGNEAVLAVNDGSDGRRLLVRTIPPSAGWGQSLPTIMLDSYLGKATPGKGFLKGEHLPAHRLTIERDNVIEPGFKILILPFQEGDPLPSTNLTADGNLAVAWPDHQETITAKPDAAGRTALGLN